MKTAGNLIDVRNVTDLDLLKKHIVSTDGFRELSKERQEQIFAFCIAYSNHEICRENLRRVRLAISYIYFGWKG